MGVMGVFKWLRKDIIQRDRRRGLTPKINGLNNNEAYRNALQAFIDRRRNPNEAGAGMLAPNSPDKERLDIFIKANNGNEMKKKRNDKKEKVGIYGVPHIKISDMIEVRYIPGTEDRYMEVVSAVWGDTSVSLRRSDHPDFRDAMKADLEVLTQIRHPNVLLLMATTQTNDHGFIGIFEQVECTLYHYLHEDAERMSIQKISMCGVSLADALKHAHTRGYVHGFISSHCIFIAAASGNVKLGGWELASTLNNTKTMHEYEERLRYEAYRWQAPEIYRGEEPSKATDVYGLALVIWEMSTSKVPWSGLRKSEVKARYLQTKLGVVIDTYDFPPFLRHILKTGLALDVPDRTLEMPRMQEFLRSLRIQSDGEEPFYVEETGIDHVQQVFKTIPLDIIPPSFYGAKFNMRPMPPTPPIPMPPTPPISMPPAPPIPKRHPKKKGSNSNKSQARTLNQNQPRTSNQNQPRTSNQNQPRTSNQNQPRTSNQNQPRTSNQNQPRTLNQNQPQTLNQNQPRTLNQNQPQESEKPKPRSPIGYRRNEIMPDKVLKRVYKRSDLKYIKNFDAIINNKTPVELINMDEYKKGTVKQIPKKIPRVLPMSPELIHIVDSSDDESSSDDTRTSIRKLRQTLASKRNDFFYGSDTTQVSQTENELPESEKSKILTEIRSKDYEPYKPASHKTSIEPKQNKSSGQYNLTSPKRVTQNKNQKSTYSYVPTAVRDAVVQPKVLNSDSQSFFESSLWQKEKMICISKMRKDDIDDSTYRVSRRFPAVDADKNDLAHLSDETYTIDGNTETNGNGESSCIDASTDWTNSTVSNSKSLQALKNSLQRATEIVLSSTTQDDTTTIVSSPAKSPETFDQNNSAANESLFEDLNELKRDSSDGEIKSIERSNNGETLFFSIDNKSDVKDVSAVTPPEIEENVARRRSASRDDSKKGSFEPCRFSGAFCESIAEIANENDHSSSESKRDDSTVILSRSPVNSKITENREIASLESINQEMGIVKQDDQKTSFAFMIFNEKNGECHSCSPNNNIVRRRSLPAALGQLKNLNNVSLGKLSIRRGDLPDNTVEDIYIDDEFDSLNVNMVLFDGDVTTDDEDFIPNSKVVNKKLYQKTCGCNE